MSLNKELDGFIPCDGCGEARGYVHTADAALCQECFEVTARNELEPFLGYRPCGQLLVNLADVHSICIERAGTEHDHM